MGINYEQHTNIYVIAITTFVITKVISNNIALSLGMIGALSIVGLEIQLNHLYRTIIYFVLITLGIIIHNLKYGFC